MIRISRRLSAAASLLLVLAATPVSSDTALQKPVIESTSSGLITFSREEKAIRVAAVFAAKDRAVVPTLVRFLDQGGNVLKEVRGDPGLARTPFIMVTAESKTENVIAAKKAGVNNYIVKPFNARTLKSKIDAVFPDAEPV